MYVHHDPACAEYAAPGHPEAPGRVLATAALLAERHPEWLPVAGRYDPLPSADDAVLLRAHTRELLHRLRHPEGPMFDPDTPALPGMDAHARRAAGAAVGIAALALDGTKAFSLLRPPGHHATADRIQGFCYLNSVAVAALHAREALGANRVAVWDFDAHHGNGTESILHRRNGLLYVSCHQYPGYPNAGADSFDNIRNYPVSPGTPADRHIAALADSWAEVLAFQPDLVLVSAGFDAYAGDPLTDLRLRPKEFAVLGEWLRAAPCPVGAILEGGYSGEMPLLVNAFLEAWEGAG
jgi:acetoin utilization deacetylase AcuC-like enzyme